MAISTVTEAALKALDKIDKKEDSINPTGKADPKISGGYHSAVINGKTVYFKTKPLTVLEHANALAKIYGITLSDNQKKVLVEIRGNSPVLWDTSASEIILMVGQGGGKNTIMEFDASYQARYLCNIVGDPYEVMGGFCKKLLARNLNFEITNNSLVSATQADTVFFDRVKTALKSTMMEQDNFFEKYMGMDMREEGLGDIKSKVIEFPTFAPDTGRLKFYSLDSKISSPEGKTIITGYMDEPSRAETQNAYRQAKKLYAVIRGNTTGRFKNGVGKTIPFSYPNMTEWDLTYFLIEQEKKAKIEFEKKNKGQLYNSGTKYFIFTTYEMNPNVSKTDPDKQKDYATDMEDSLARYECIKSKTQYAFFKPYVERIRECANPALQNRVTYDQVIRARELKNGGTRNYTALQLSEIKSDRRYRMWAGDFSINKANSSLISGYSETIEEEIGNKLSQNIQEGNYVNLGDMKRKVVIDLMLVWSPSKEHPMDYFNAQEIVETMLDNFPNSVQFNCDAYQLSQMSANFEMRGIEANPIQFKADKQLQYYTDYKTALSNGLVETLYHPLMIEEAERVQRVTTDGNKIVPGNNFTKDIIDTCVILYNALTHIDPKNQSALTAGIDRFKDSKLIDMINKMIIFENQAIIAGNTNIAEYVRTKMMISEETHQRLIETKEEMFP